MTRPEVTVSLVSHGQGCLAGKLLVDLAQLDIAELIVTVNVPEDEAFLRSYPPERATVIRNATPKGFGANHNTAFARCRTPWFVVINPDVRLPADPFASLLATASALPGVGVVAPEIVDSAGRAEDSVRTNPTPLSVAGRLFDRKIGCIDEPRSLDSKAGFFWLAGMFLMFSSAAFRRVGGFDERYFLYYEDFDICARLQRAGFVIAVDREVAAVHDAQRDSRRSLRHLKWHVGSLLRVWLTSAFWWVLLKCRPVGRG